MEAQMKIQFHLDEHIHSGIAAGLRGHGIDVTTAAESGLIEADDAAHLLFAQQTQRVIVTHDEDFLAIHANGVEHAGIAYSHQLKYSIGELLRMLLLLHECYSAEEMLGRIEFL
jgi:hypothetical protein